MSDPDHPAPSLVIVSVEGKTVTTNFPSIEAAVSGVETAMATIGSDQADVTRARRVMLGSDSGLADWVMPYTISLRRAHSLSSVMSNAAQIDLRQARMKHQRCLEHLAALEREQEQWFATLPVVEPRWTFEGDQWSLLWESFPQPPERLALIAGDAIQNARISLEYAAAAIITSYGGGLGPPAGFPVADTEVAWQSRFRSRMPGVPASWQGVIERHQPFTGDLRLAMLAKMSNEDKHHLLLPRVVVMTGGKAKVAAHPYARVVHHESPVLYGSELNPGDVILRVTMEPADTHPDLLVSELNPRIALTYWKGADEAPCISVKDLQSIANLVAEILDEIDRGCEPSGEKANRSSV